MQKNFIQCKKTKLVVPCDTSITQGVAGLPFPCREDHVLRVTVTMGGHQLMVGAGALIGRYHRTQVAGPPGTPGVFWSRRKEEVYAMEMHH